MDVLTVSNPVFRQWALCCSVLILKLHGMALLTARHRMFRNIFSNPEDAKLMSTKVKVDEDVERVRRAHLNDLENIPAFLVMSSIFLFTEPAAFTAKVCFYGFTVARVLHSIFYLNCYQPHRALAFGAGLSINVFMAVKCILFFW